MRHVSSMLFMGLYQCDCRDSLLFWGVAQNEGLDVDEAIDISYALSLAFIYAELSLLKPLRCWYLAKLVGTLSVLMAVRRVIGRIGVRVHILLALKKMACHLHRLFLLCFIIFFGGV